MSDFAGTEYEFAAGSLFGLRGWDIDERGRLHGVTHREVWTPGENAAICRATIQIPCPGVAEVEVPAAGPSLSEQAVAPKKKLGRKKQIETSPAYEDAYSEFTVSFTATPHCGHATCYSGYHTVPTSHRYDPNCQCGFWAYDEASFKPHGEVVGVIEAFGKTTIGTKGFRAEKARIVGLCKQSAGDKPLSRSVVARLSALYPDALLCDDMDQLVTVFDGVMKTWADVGEDFWSQPVKPKEDAGLWNRYFNTVPATAYSYPRWLTSGGI